MAVLVENDIIACWRLQPKTLNRRPQADFPRGRCRVLSRLGECAVEVTKGLRVEGPGLRELGWEICFQLSKSLFAELRSDYCREWVWKSERFFWPRCFLKRRGRGDAKGRRVTRLCEVVRERSEFRLLSGNVSGDRIGLVD